MSEDKLKHDDEPIEQDKEYNHLVFGGGGIRGIAYIGALDRLTQEGLLNNVQTCIGTSVGALIAAMYVIGYTPIEMKDLMLKVKLDDLQDIDIMNVINNYGLDSGRKVVEYVKDLIKQKCGTSEITFKELYTNTNKYLIITGTCVTDRCIKYFSHEETPNVKIYDAIRLSIGIPLLFTSVKYQNKRYSDGGILDNFPIHLMRNKSNVLGLKLVSDHTGCNNTAADTPENFVVNLIACFFGVIEDLRNVQCDNIDVIKINTGDINSIQFNINDDTRNRLYMMGYSAR